MDQITFKNASSTIKPEPMEIIEGSVFIRKKIEKKVEKHEDGSSDVIYMYEELILTRKEFDEYKDFLIIKGQAEMIQSLDGLTFAMSDMYMLMAMTGMSLKKGGE